MEYKCDFQTINNEIIEVFNKRQMPMNQAIVMLVESTLQMYMTRAIGGLKDMAMAGLFDDFITQMKERIEKQ